MSGNALQRFVFLFGLGSLASVTRAQSYIIGGQDVGPRDPIKRSTVAIYEPSPNGHGGSLCTASLIRKNIALTAAHCVHPDGSKPVILFGPDLHSPDTPRRQADTVVVNEKWRASGGRGMDQGDIALVKFPGGVPKGYGTVPMVKSDAEIRPGATAVLAGYGISDARTHEGSGRLRKAEVRVLQSRPGKSEMILDQSHGHGACHGDSGGPAFIRRNGRAVLAGVTNRGYPNHAPDDCGHKVVYTKLPSYGPWITKNEKSLENSGARGGSEAPGLWSKKERPRVARSTHPRTSARSAKTPPRQRAASHSPKKPHAPRRHRRLRALNR